MSKDRNIDDAELAKISGAGGGNVHVEETPDDVPENDPGFKIGPPEGGGGGGGAFPDGLESDADTGGNQELNRD